MASRKGCKYFIACGSSDNCSRCGGFEKAQKCSICGKRFTEYGNDPWPVKTGKADVCCNDCNSKFVLAARLAAITKKGE